MSAEQRPLGSWPRLAPAARAGGFSHELVEGAAERRRLDLVEMADELEMLAPKGGEGAAATGGGFLRETVEERAYRCAERPGDMCQHAGRDAVGAALVFLDLLEGDADRDGERLLGHADERALRADAQGDLQVDRIGRSLTPSDVAGHGGTLLPPPGKGLQGG